MQKKTVTLLTISLCLLSVLTTCSKKNRDTSSTKQEKAIPVEAINAAYQDVEQFLEGVGSFLPQDEVVVSSEVEGMVKKLYVDEGSTVKKGDLLIKIDDEKFILQVKENEASLREAEARAKNSQTTLERQLRLFQEGVINQQTLDDNKTQLSLYQAQGENIQAKLDRAKRSLRDTNITSPLDGVVSKRSVSTGEYVKTGNELLKIVDSNPLKLTFTLPEKFTGQIKLGQKVIVKTKAYPDEQFYGKVYYINPKVDLDTRTIELKALVENNEYKLKPGFFVDVKLLIGMNKNSAVLPEGAVLVREGKFIVMVIENNRIKYKPVTPGARFFGKVEILEGVNPNDSIVLSAMGELVEGSPVTIAKSAKAS
jgi:membrane fusion protein (multidrug efflux system)